MISRFKIAGHSMEPVLKEGEQVFVTKPSEPAVGDIIIFEHEGLHLVKRIARIENNEFIAGADNPGHGEYRITHDQIVGKLSFRYWPLQKIGFLR